MISARRVLDELKRNHVTHVIGLPDNSSIRMFQLLAEDRDIRLVSVTREGEAFAIAAGLWIGGRNPLVLVQNTGLFESGDGIRGTIIRMRVPLVCLVTYRGYAKAASAPRRNGESVSDMTLLSDAHLDSAALITEPTLRSWGIPYGFLHNDEHIFRISEAFEIASRDEQPFALLITNDMT